MPDLLFCSLQHSLLRFHYRFLQVKKSHKEHNNDSWAISSCNCLILEQSTHDFVGWNCLVELHCLGLNAVCCYSMGCFDFGITWAIHFSLPVKVGFENYLVNPLCYSRKVFALDKYLVLGSSVNIFCSQPEYNLQ